MDQDEAKEPKMSGLTKKIFESLVDMPKEEFAMVSRMNRAERRKWYRKRRKK